MNCSTSSWCFPRVESHLSRPKTHSGRGRKRLKAFFSFSTSWPHWPELTVLFRITLGWSWVTFTRRPLKISGSQWSHSTWASGRGMWHISLLLRLILPILDVSRENQQNNVFWWRYCIRYIVCLRMLSCSTRSDLLLRLENLGEATVQLRERNWRIFSLSGGENADQNEKFKQCCRDLK